MNCLTFEGGTSSSSQNVGNETTDLHCVTSQQSEDLIYATVEAWNHAKNVRDLYSIMNEFNFQHMTF
jgi:hypothetical protein